MGLPEEDFNSYATHRGDHLTAMRATFANPQLVNEMAVVDGQVKKGSLARVEPDGKVVFLPTSRPGSDLLSAVIPGPGRYLVAAPR